MRKIPSTRLHHQGYLGSYVRPDFALVDQGGNIPIHCEQRFPSLRPANGGVPTWSDSVTVHPQIIMVYSLCSYAYHRKPQVRSRPAGIKLPQEGPVGWNGSRSAESDRARRTRYLIHSYGPLHSTPKCVCETHMASRKSGTFHTWIPFSASW